LAVFAFVVMSNGVFVAPSIDVNLTARGYDDRYGLAILRAPQSKNRWQPDQQPTQPRSRINRRDPRTTQRRQPSSDHTNIANDAKRASVRLLTP
jgi:hypothetical protein